MDRKQYTTPSCQLVVLRPCKLICASNDDSQQTDDWLSHRMDSSPNCST